MDPALRVLRERFGFPDFRKGQRTLVAAVLDGKDALGILPTGGGKSLCYQVPTFLLPGMTLVVSPLISLMEDQAGRANVAGLLAQVLHSGLDPAMGRDVLREAAQGSVKVLLVAPERFNSRSFLQVVRDLPVSLVVIDEAHCISSWGHDFRPAYRELGLIRPRLAAQVPILALTATATPRVRADVERVLGLRNPVRVVQSFDRPNLRWEVARFASRRQKSHGLQRVVWKARRGDGDPGAVLVYAATRKGVEGIRDGLARLGLPAMRYHAGLPQEERSRVQELFLRSPGPVVVATNAFGMGIDRADVRLVVHATLPRSLEDFYQEAGRAGRDGGAARSLVLDDPWDAALRRRFLESSVPPIPGGISGRLAFRTLKRHSLSRDRRCGEEERLRAAEGYLDTRGCRRRHLLTYFGEELSARSCGLCDRCSGASG
ncbi:MAG: ATP-dependent DNA helicase RecQ [Gemmatimonadota bacterium]